MKTDPTAKAHSSLAEPEISGQGRPRKTRAVEVAPKKMTGTRSGKVSTGSSVSPSELCRDIRPKKVPVAARPIVPGRKTAAWAAGEPVSRTPRKAVSEMKASEVTSQMTARFAAVLPRKMPGGRRG